MAIITATLLSEGKKIDAIYSLISIDIRREANRIPYASLALLDGDAAKRTFELSNAKYFEPGKEIEIRLRYESQTKDATVFKGYVVRHAVEANEQGSLLQVELKDKAVKLTRSRKSAVFVDLSDSEVIDKLIKASGLKSGKIEATKPKHPQLVQFGCTDWDFLLLRAESQGLLVGVTDGEVSLRKVDLSGPAKASFNYGISEIYNFEFGLDLGDQVSKVTSSGWDLKELKISPVTNGKAFALKQGNLQGDKLANAVGFAPCLLSYPQLAHDERQAWTDGRLMRSRLSMIRGRLSVTGFADIKLFDLIEIDGIGDRFNGKALVTGICHRVDLNGWRTDIQYGLSATLFAQEVAVQEPSTSGLLSGISGLHVAVVDQFEEDPDKQFRVRILLPGIDEKSGSVWARLAAPDAGKNRGWFFRPEVGDEVVVGFFQNDPRQPVILGAMYSSKSMPSDKYSKVSKENKTRSIVTKTGSVIGFIDDKKGSVFIETAEGAKVLLDDENKLMQLVDQNGNEIILNKDGISIKSCKDLILEASGNVEIKGAKVNVK